MRSPSLSLYDMGRSVEKIRSWLVNQPTKLSTELPADLSIISPFMLPFNNNPVVRRFNKIYTARTIKKIMQKSTMECPIVITTFPCTCDLVGEFNEIIHIYYCVDDFTNWPGVNRKLITSMEDMLIDRCDLVMATSEDLCLKKARPGKKPLLLSHGVQFDHFNSAIGSLRPAEYQDIPSPIIGFFGALSSWLDFPLITTCAKAHPDWSFVLIGPADTDISSLVGLSNVYIFGKIPYELLPSYAACFDAAIIPFQVNDLTISVSPLKLLEYLSCGLPVVSTYMSEITKFSEVITIAHGAEEFISALEHELATDGELARARRIDIARANSWQSVADKFCMTVTNRIAPTI